MFLESLIVGYKERPFIFFNRYLFADGFENDVTFIEQSGRTNKIK